ncbi:Glutaredoxin-like [Parasponia andersonii]|uniref:Glutaredoxin-like n=1 Tax=Parasponia andersonii TaxID=3476 RepID=A0A2P5B6M4_PARAD|nr:Glutaredoxin-like [Parasponia andersonii]
MQQAIPYKSWPPLHQTTPLNRLPTVVTEANSNSNNVSINSNNYSDKGALTRRNVDVNAVIGLVTDNAVMVFVRRGCCMGHVVKHLLLGHGVNPAVYEVDETEELDLLKELETIGSGEAGNILSPENRRNVQFPAVFIGGKLFGGLDRVMAAHISGELVPLLKQAGALWL